MAAHPTVFDYIVVGGGAAGCAVAGRLSESGRYDVALIEAGPPDRSLLIHVPGANIFATSHPRLNWNFQSDPVPGLDNRRLPLAQGKVLGGSSSINGMIFARGHAHEYDAWRDMGCIGWGFADLLPYFRKVEANARGASQWHGGKGPIKVKRATSALPIVDRFLLAAAEAGFPVQDDLNCNTLEAFGHFDMNVDRGRRQSAARCYLGRGRRNLHILTQAHCTRIVLRQGRAVGIEILRNGTRLGLAARREVILSAGAINSPQILMLSGIGDASELRAHGIEVALELPGVGRRLQNHPVYRMQYGVAEPITAYKYLSLRHGMRLCLDYALHRRGFLSEGVLPAGGFLRSRPDMPTPDIQIIMAPTLMTRHGPGVRGLMPRQHGIAVLVSLGHSRSLGRVSLHSSNPLAAPAIQPNYFDAPGDLPALVRGIQRTRTIMKQPSLAALLLREIEPGDAIGENVTALEADIRRTGFSYYHYSGTCSMGSGAQSVVDTRLRVRGVDGLRVADASIMPLLPNANTHAPTLMIAEKAAEIMLNEYHHPIEVGA